jgi:hypothetical protein
MPGHCKGVCTSDTMVWALVRGSTRDIRRGEWVQKPLIFMCFHEVFLGIQQAIWSKQHNGKVNTLLSPIEISRIYTDVLCLRGTLRP